MEKGIGQAEIADELAQDKEIRILMLEDSAADAFLMDYELRKAGINFESKRIETREEFLEEVSSNRPDLILLDHGLPTFDGFTALALAREKAPDVPVIFVTGSLGEETVVKTLKNGALDYVLKHHMPDLVPAVHRALLHAEERARRRQAEEALQRSEERYRRLVELCPDALLVETDGEITFVNTAAIRLLGASCPSDLIGRPIESIFHPHLFAALQPKLQKLHKSKVTQLSCEQLVRCLDDRFIDVELAASVVNRKDKSTVQFILHDITDRKRFEEELQARIRQQEAVAELGQRALATCDVARLIDETVDLVARTLGVDFCHLLELKPDSADWLWRAGVGWKDNLSGTAIPMNDTWSVADFALRSDAAIIFEDVRRESRFHGEPLWQGHGIVSGMTVLLKLRGQPFAVMGVYSTRPRAFKPHDLHFLQAVANTLAAANERRQAEQEIYSLNADLEARVAQRTMQLEMANSELEAFSYSVSHDLRAPLRHVDGFMEILRANLPEKMNDQADMAFCCVSEAVRKMSRLIEDLLAFSRMSRSEMHFVPIQLDQMIGKVRHELRLDCEKRQITWDVQPLPEIQGDPEMLQLVITNLVANALKYTRPREQARIEIGSLPGEKETVIYVRDNGVGFDSQYVHKLFGVFQRLHSTKEFDGTGIGLAIVRRIIARHGGRTWAEGKLGDGATFYFSLPAR